MFTVAAFAVLLDQAWRIAEHMTATATSAAAGTAGTGNSGEFEHHQLGLSTTPTIEKTYVRSVGEDRSLSANPSGNDGGLHIENVDTHSHSASKTVSVGYMARHARTLREESDRLEKSLEEDWRQAAKSRSASTGKPATTTRISHPLHLVLYASPPTTHNNNTNVMAELLRLQAERSAFFVSVTVLGPNDIPDEFHREFKDMLPSPQVHQQTVDFGLWRYPLWENVMHHIPLYDTILFLDSSSTAGVYAGGVSMLDKWVKRVVESSERKNEPRRELMRFPQDPRKNGDLKWTNDAVFDAFGLEIQGDNSWWYVHPLRNAFAFNLLFLCLTLLFHPKLAGQKGKRRRFSIMVVRPFSSKCFRVQYVVPLPHSLFRPKGVMIVRNGAQWRNMTSLIYRTLAKDRKSRLMAFTLDIFS
jgi:hypothetical protein